MQLRERERERPESWDSKKWNERSTWMGEGNRRRWNLRIQDSALRSDRSNRERGQLYNFTP